MWEDNHLIFIIIEKHSWTEEEVNSERKRNLRRLVWEIIVLMTLLKLVRC